MVHGRPVATSTKRPCWQSAPQGKLKPGTDWYPKPLMGVLRREGSAAASAALVAHGADTALRAPAPPQCRYLYLSIAEEPWGGHPLYLPPDSPAAKNRLVRLFESRAAGEAWLAALPAEAKAGMDIGIVELPVEPPAETPCRLEEECQNACTTAVSSAYAVMQEAGCRLVRNAGVYDVVTDADPRPPLSLGESASNAEARLRLFSWADERTRAKGAPATGAATAAAPPDYTFEYVRKDDGDGEISQWLQVRSAPHGGVLLTWEPESPGMFEVAEPGPAGALGGAATGRSNSAGMSPRVQSHSTRDAREPARVAYASRR